MKPCKMEEHKNIDRLFQEKFKDFEVFPEPVVWRNIENHLLKKKKRRILPLWLRAGSAAAILIGIALVGFRYFNQSESSINSSKISNDRGETIENNRIIADEGKDVIVPETNKSSIQKPTNTVPQIGRTNAIASQQIQKTVTKEHSIVPQERIVTPSNSIADLQVKSKRASTLQQLNEENNADTMNEKGGETMSDLKIKANIMDAVLAQSDNEKSAVDIEKSAPMSKWSIGSNVAPVFYNSMGQGSPIDPDLASNDKSANTGISYGIKVNYKLTNKLTLQSGLNTVELGYETRNAAVLLSSSLANTFNANIYSELNGVGIDIVSTQQQNSETFSQRSMFDNAGKIDQSFNYIEIPLEAKYALIQNKLGVNLVGGFSTYMLYQNNISVTSFGKTTSLGEASNINTVNFSGNIGLDLNVSLSKKLFFNTSPMLKYQFNTFSEDSGGFKPYFLGIYAGLNFRF
ncbi:outer membrane beta-barrel protein [Flavobacteriaceae bacterium F08102]|nr:outer membrane beta-barrel protein [Flavobacteriaceae bacterium F08102]